MGRLSVKVLVVVLLLLAATEEQGGSVQVALARVCTRPSHKFHWACLDTNKCASACLTEGYTGGKCGGRRGRRCFCTWHC
ncbi:hypothetical protein CFC21_037736 [Triticum aestivum]|uniref:Knottins-like domain-containing protein n=2 Tax=Triticum aestivum TaxID=4565 RepID=A0A3B6ER74_WHEAT|nr:defensin Ec-AMP-D2-like [Triticum dicoccoides]XP_044337657.1 defensin Ec-AMP-D2-like [Triticum aestivum]XP_048568505.1 defensin Ec-AMP-D2-like [Triticum urartu]KAF7025566.1 hypothetical protein CFC21_037736 [Triticum aestivum]